MSLPDSVPVPPQHLAPEPAGAPPAPESTAPESTPPAPAAEGDRAGETAIVTPLGQVPKAEPRWLWKDHIPQGCVTLLVGPAGAGKSLVALDLAARLTSGRHWPGQDPQEEPSFGQVLVVAPVYEAHDVVPWRLARLGADMDLMRLFQGLNRPLCRGSETLIRQCLFPKDIDRLDDLMGQVAHLQLVLIDSLFDFCFTRRAEAAALRRLDELAARHKVAILVVAATEIRYDHRDEVRAPANRAYSGTRCIWTVAPDRDLEERRELLPTRLHSDSRPRGFAFRIDDNGVLQWEALRGPRARSEVAAAMEWLEATLADGKSPMQQVEARAAAFGIKGRTLRRARERLGVICRKVGFGVEGIWLLSLPAKGGSAASSEAGAPARQYENSDPRMGLPEELRHLSRQELARKGYFPAIDGSGGWERLLLHRASELLAMRNREGESAGSEVAPGAPPAQPGTDSPGGSAISK